MDKRYEQYAEDKKERKALLARLSGRPDHEISFEDFDKLNLEGYGKNLIDIIKECHMYPKSNDSKSYVIGLDAEWGSGKTTFLSMLYSYLDREYDEGENPILPVYYNAWKGDFWNNAFEPFFDCIWNSVPGWCKALKLYALADKWNIPLTNREDAVIDAAIAREGESGKLIAGYGLHASGLLIASYLAKPLTAEMDSTFRVDFICKDNIIVECKAVSEVLGNHRAQLFNYMRILQKQCGVLVNFYPFSAQVERYFYDKDTHQIVATDGHVIYNYDRRMRVSSM